MELSNCCGATMKMVESRAPAFSWMVAHKAWEFYCTQCGRLVKRITEV